jgi:uncharacterized FlgJ-related protein
MRKLFLIISLLLAISHSTISMAVDNTMVLERMLKRQRIKEIKNSDFNIELLLEYVNLINSDFNDVPIRQFILESGWFRSQLFLEYNNIAGMKLPLVRTTTAIGKALGHAYYNHWTDSVDDYIHWRDYWKEKGFSTQYYYEFLRDIGYATSEKYEERLKNINLEKLCNYQNSEFLL